MMGDDKLQIGNSDQSVTVEWSEGRLLAESGGRRPPVQVLCGHSLFDGSSGWDSIFLSHGIRVLTASGQQPDQISPDSIIPGSFRTLRQFSGVSALLTADRLPAVELLFGMNRAGEGKML
jgi:hypothetical protein